ncbi:MAG: hypothetical protein COA44_02860 [Arcobacter sp.]|nr:MAG: hypothetical protein COA44_02860 [Arcobacter sp.]
MKVLILLGLISLSLFASVSMGKIIYKKECAHCHNEAKYFASHKKAKEWKIYFNTDLLKRLHQDKNLSLPYFQSIKLNEDKKHLKALFLKYSKDRGSHNSCY